MITTAGSVLLAGAGTAIAAMLALGASLADEWRGPIPREEDPARFRRELALYLPVAAAGAILLFVGLR
ncbi:MAG TPA: hypothetical protein VF702_01240 [Allosphingosinicella sp.]|jgi:hypothetical protein